MTYAGDVTVDMCWKSLSEISSAQLVDVRTSAEWNFVGVPVLGSINKEAIFVEWQLYPQMQVNPAFVDQVASELDHRGANSESPVLMLCRSGVRSIAAAKALTTRGFSAVYNVMGGFEGDKDEEGHRSTTAGWKFENLPWRQ